MHFIICKLALVELLKINKIIFELGLEVFFIREYVEGLVYLRQKIMVEVYEHIGSKTMWSKYSFMYAEF